MIIIFWIIIALMTGFAMTIAVYPLLRYATMKISDKWLPILILIMIPLLGILLYFHWGASRQLERYWVLKKEAQQVKNQFAKINQNPQQLIEELRVHLQRVPQSAKGWYLLGQLYFGESQYDKAEHALFKAYQLKPASHQYAVAYVQAAFFNHHRRLTNQMEAILKAVIKRAPHYVPALNLLAIDAYLRKNYLLAVQYWQTLLPLFPPTTKDGQMLLKMIAMAQKHIAAQNATR